MPTAVVPINPLQIESKLAADVIAARLERVRLRLQEGGSRELKTSFGEALMREWLTVLIDSTAFTDPGRPGFLINPETNEQMEYDRWYYNFDVAFEFQGPQHFVTTAKHPDPNRLGRRKFLDLIKIGLSVRNGVKMVEVEPPQLRKDHLLGLIPLHVPRRPLAGWERALVLLEQESRAYRVKFGVRE